MATLHFPKLAYQPKSGIFNTKSLGILKANSVKKVLLLILVLSPLLGFSQVLTNTSPINISKTWSQEPNGYTYPVRVRVPTGPVPTDGFPVCILLHGNGGNGNGMVTQFANVLECHVLVAPTGYQNSWNICAENSDAPDVEMVTDLVNLIQGYSNIDSNHIRVVGVSNGSALANRVFIENTDPGLDIICGIVSHLNEPQYHSGGFYKPSATTNSSSPFCGYDVLTNPLSTRKYLSISNTNDSLIPYIGGNSPVGVDFLSAENAIYTIAQNQGYSGAQLAIGTTMGNPAVTEFSYLSGNVVLIAGDAAHGTNSTEQDYITQFFSDCSPLLSLEDQTRNEIKVYPNPTSSRLTIARVSGESISYSVLNPLGQEVLAGNCTGKTLQIDLSPFPSNIYFLKFGSQTIKIFKH